ncbi:hypothetical protein Bca4012_011380 [Brassica carinata]
MASQAILLLQKQLKDLCKHPVDGFSAGLVDEKNIFEWNVTIIGPPDTLYEGGFFNAIMTFPQNYPNSPPTVRFTSDMWHPNVYSDGRVCISILHPPGDDPSGYELASERWTPVHTVESIMLSIISMLSGPNDESPANVEAAKEWREKRDEFKKKVSRCVRKSQEMFLAPPLLATHFARLPFTIFVLPDVETACRFYVLQNSDVKLLHNHLERTEQDCGLYEPIDSKSIYKLS